MSSVTQLLGGLTPSAFLRAHWQKAPFLVRGAVPGFRGLVGRDALLRLAARSDVTSRLVIDHQHRYLPEQHVRTTQRHGARHRSADGRGQRWERHDGPLAGLRASSLPKTGWTLLVHGLERLVPGGWPLLQRFSFLPWARLDDVMVSYAADGGSVGPHDDDYDVFLLQGPGRRRWQIARSGDRAIDPDAAIKVLARFTPEEEYVLDPGDMLYLPPGVAHHGVAEGPCFTYSIGLLAPSSRDLVEGFLGYLGGTLPRSHTADRALYADPGLRPPRDPAELPASMIEHAARVLESVRWDRHAVEDFLGAFLTRPRPSDRFTPRRESIEAFARRLGGGGRLVLAPASRALWHADRFYLNGEAQRVPARLRPPLRELARQRWLGLPVASAVRDLLAAALHDAFAAGMVVYAAAP